MTIRIIYPPRPKGKMSHVDLAYYEKSGKWIAQRKFRGSRCVIYISVDRQVICGNRHGAEFVRFKFDASYKEELLDVLNLEEGQSYWLDGELMNKDKNATNEIIFFDVLQAGRYFFGGPSQMDRLDILKRICGHPQKKCTQNIALEVSKRFWMAETFEHGFLERFNESLHSENLEGLVLRKKDSALDNFGIREYETTNLVRCRKKFSKDKGYEF